MGRWLALAVGTLACGTLACGTLATSGTALWADIVITEDDWDSWVELNNAAGTPPAAIVTTVDGRKSLHLTRPSGDKSALYQVNVTQMPAGMERFPVEVISRQVMDSSNGCTIRNLTLDPEPDPNFQGSFCSILMNDGGAGGPALARDDRWVLDPLVGEDPAGTIGMSGLQVGDPTEDTTFAPDDVTTTVQATLELQMGINLLRIDPTDPRDLPAYAPDCGSQFFSITIGLGVAGLQGSVVEVCRVTRSLSADRYGPGETLTVTLSAGGVGGPVTIQDTFPATWVASNFGTGTVMGNTISFEVTASGDVTYDLTVPGDFCDIVAITGTFDGGADCMGDTGGASDLRCTVVTGGIIITEDDWDKFNDRGIEPGIGNPATPEPQIVVTDDGRKSVYFSGQPDDNQAFLVYKVNVTQMPDGADEGRFPIRVEGRHTSIGGFFIRNLTVSPIPDTGFQNQASFAAVMIRAAANDIFALGTGPQPFDPCIDFLDRDEGIDIITTLWSDVGGGNAALATDLPGQETGDVETITVMLDLVLGENILRIDTTDLRPQPCDPKGESGHQVFTLQIGPGASELQGEVVAECAARRTLSSRSFSPGGTVTVTLTSRNIEGATTLTDTFPAGWTPSNFGAGTVMGNTIEFSVTMAGDVTYDLTSPADVCENIALSGTIAGVDCAGDIGGDTDLVCIPPLPANATVYTFDAQAVDGPVTTDEIEDFFVLLGNDAVVGPPGWEIAPNTVNPANSTEALHISANGAPGEPFFSRVAILRGDVFEAQEVFVSADISWDDNDWAGIYFRFVGNSDNPFQNSYYYLKIYADNRGIVLHRVTDGFEVPVAMADQPTPVNPGTTVNVAITAEEDQITVRFDGTLVPGMDPFTDLDPLLGCGSIGFGEETNPTFYDNLAFVKLDDEPCPCVASRSLSTSRFAPGDTVTVTVTVRNLMGAATLTETFPDGWNVSGNPNNGTVNGSQIAFDLAADGEVSYELTVPGGFCELGEFSGTLMGAGGCSGEVTGRSDLGCIFGCAELRESGAVREMLIIGPIDAGGNTGGNCDDNGNLEFTDYLTDGDVDEESIQAVFGDELQPDFGGAAGGVGVGFAPNPDINPRTAEGILTVWLADTDGDGRINFNDADNLGTPLDDYIIYSLIYLDNTTGGDLPVTLLVGSDDAVKVRVNGELVHINSVCRGLGGVGAADPVTVTLSAGINTVLIAVVERGGGTDVRLLVYDETGFGPLVDGSVVACLAPELAPPTGGFVRGDADSNGSINLTDGIVILNFLFLGGVAPSCLDAADSDDEGNDRPSITDAVIIFSWLFLGGDAPRAPSPMSPAYPATDCGPDPTPDDGMDCAVRAATCQ